MTSILFPGQCSSLVNGCTTYSRATQSLHAYTETNMILFISHIIAPRHMRDSEIISNPGNHIWLCNDSLDGDSLQFKNGGRPSDVAEL